MGRISCIILIFVAFVNVTKANPVNGVMEHYYPEIYDNAYVVDTIEINTPQVISIGYPGSYSDFSFVTDSVTVVKIINELKSIKKWSDFEKYIKNENSLINSCYVYMINTDYFEEEFLLNLSKRDKKNRSIVDIRNCPVIERGKEVASFEGIPILLSKFTTTKVEKFVLLLVNAGFLRYRCMDCGDKRYYVPTVMPYNKYVKVVFPIHQK